MSIEDQNSPLVQDGELPKLDRTHLKDLATDLLRKYIILGRIRPGMKLVERQVAKLLSISRAPARDALMQLEKEGLVVSRSDARYVIEFNQEDVRNLSQVRHVLERLAIELAVQHIDDPGRADLLAILQKMERATETQDRIAYIESDVEIHQCIWRLSGNPHLFKTLNSMSGPLFMFVAGNAARYDWIETLHLHRDLVNHLVAGDREGSLQSLERHMDSSLQRLLGTFKLDQQSSED